MNNNWLDIDVLEDYLDGKLDARAMHQVEKYALEDPFVAEALAGLSESPKRSQSLSLLQRQLQERIAQKPVERKVWGITFQRLSIAATAAVLFVSAGIIFWMRGEQNNPTQIAQHTFKEKGVEASLDTTYNYKQQPQIRTEKETERYANNQVNSSPVMAQQEELDDVADRSLAGKPEFYENQRDQIKDGEYGSATPVLSKTLEEPKPADGLAAQTTDRETKTSAPVSSSGSATGFRSVNNSIKGRVIAQSDGLPLPGVSLRIAGSDKAVATDAKGEFEIFADEILKSDKLKLRADYIGYASKEVIVKPDQIVDITLAEDFKSLNEGVTTGSALIGRSKKAPAKSAEQLKVARNTMDAGGVKTILPTVPQPIGGWEYFQSYLKANNRLTENADIGKEVELDVLIKASGKPGMIKVNKSLGRIYDDEAIRLIKDGPKWELPSGGTNKVTLKVQF